MSLRESLENVVIVKMMNKLHTMRKANNLCHQCGAPMDRVGMNCIRCTTNNNDIKAWRLFELHDKGMCSRCHKVLDRKGWFCTSCLAKGNAHAKERNDIRRANGLCVQCLAPTEGKRYCTKCLADRKERYIKSKLKKE